MAFGDQLYRWRKARGLTQQELATASGVNVSYISNLERNFSATTKSGKPRPSEGLCDKFAKVLGVSRDEVRSAAGYAADAGILFSVAPGVRVSMLQGDEYTESDRERFKIGLGAAFEALKAQIEEEKKHK